VNELRPLVLRARSLIGRFYRSIGGCCRTVRDPAKFRKIPFRLGISSLWPGTYIGYVPDRYSDRFHDYVKRGGQMRHEDLRKFVYLNETSNCGDLARFHFFSLVVDQILKEDLKGDVAELGVYRGNTAIFLAKVARALGRTAYLFDTFEGFSADDLTGLDANKQMEFSDTSIDLVRSIVGSENIRFVNGFFPETLNQMPDTASFCLVHIDCDLYTPFKAALNYFYPRLVPGGVMIMHDYSSLYWDGVERAVDEFFDDKPETVIPIPDKSGTVVIRRVR
jgi:Macrocin-O-methyltransferase (TylF)